jgi:hypothetical protein
MLICLSAFSVTLHAQTGDALFQQSFTAGEEDNALQSVSVCDDFLPEASGRLGQIDLWMLFASGLPPEISFAVLQDNGSVNPNSATIIFSSSLSADITDTGESFAGYSIYHVSCTVGAVVNLSGSQRYWLQMDVPVGGYWLCQNPLVFGSTMWVYSSSLFQTTVEVLGTPYDSFFDLYMPVALARNSWGSIKASF